MLLIYPHQFLSTSLFSDTKDVVGSSCTFPASILKLAIFPRSPGSCYGKNWALGAGQADYYCCQTLLVGKTRADMHVCTHLCLYPLHICPWGLKTTITSLTQRVPASFFPFNICNSFSDSEKLDCCCSPFFTYLINLFSVTHLPLCCPMPLRGDICWQTQVCCFGDFNYQKHCYCCFWHGLPNWWPNLSKN